MVLAKGQSIHVRFLGLAIALVLGACSGQSNPEVAQNAGQNAGKTSAQDLANNAAPSSEQKLKVVTTFLPMTQFTKAVAGDCAEVTQLLPTNVGPHDYQAKPSDAQSLSQADVLVQNGLEIEHFLDSMIENTGNPNLKIIDSSEGLDLIPMVESEHDHHGTESEHHGEETESHDHGEFDPHIWLDPVRAMDQVNNIRDGLIVAQPTCEAQFTANAATYNAQLEALHQEIQKTLSPFAGKTFVTYHDFANYFADRYGLKVEFLVGIPEENPAPNDVKRVMEAVKKSELKTLLTESQATAGPFQALAQDLNVNISTFQPNEVGEMDSIRPDAYFTVMRENVIQLQQAFAGS